MKKLRHITVICRELYELQGASAVYDYVNKFIERQDSKDIKYAHCPHCEAETPKWFEQCLICGQ